jgi:hypothetical protein
MPSSRIISSSSAPSHVSTIHLNPDHYFQRLRIDTLATSLYGSSTEAAAASLSRAMDSVPFVPQGNDRRIAGHYTSEITGEHFRIARSGNEWYGVRLTTHDNIVLHVVAHSRLTPPLHICFQPSYTWTHGLDAYEKRSLSLAESLGFTAEELTLSRLDVCMDSETPTHVTTMGRCTGHHARGKSSATLLSHDLGPEAPYTGHRRKSRKFIMCHYFKSLCEEHKPIPGGQFFKDTWSIFRVKDRDIYRTEGRAYSQGLKHLDMKSMSCLTVASLEAYWQWLTHPYYRFESAPGIVTPEWQVIQKAKWAGDHDMLRAALDFRAHPYFIEVEDVDSDLAFDLTK